MDILYKIFGYVILTPAFAIVQFLTKVLSRLPFMPRARPCPKCGNTGQKDISVYRYLAVGTPSLEREPSGWRWGVALFVITISTMFLVFGVLVIFVGQLAGVLIVLPALLAIAWAFMVKHSMPVRACNECGYLAYGKIS